MNGISALPSPPNIICFGILCSYFPPDACIVEVLTVVLPSVPSHKTPFMYTFIVYPSLDIETTI